MPFWNKNLNSRTNASQGILSERVKWFWLSRDRGFACLLVCVCVRLVFAVSQPRGSVLNWPDFIPKPKRAARIVPGVENAPALVFFFFSFFPFPYLPVPKHGKNRALHSLLSSALFRLSFNVYLLPRCCWIIVELSRIMTLVSSALSSVSRVHSNRVHGFDYGHNAALGLGGEGGGCFFFFSLPPYFTILLFFPSTFAEMMVLQRGGPEWLEVM